MTHFIQMGAWLVPTTAITYVVPDGEGGSVVRFRVLDDDGERFRVFRSRWTVDKVQDALNRGATRIADKPDLPGGPS